MHRSGEEARERSPPAPRQLPLFCWNAGRVMLRLSIGYSFMIQAPCGCCFLKVLFLFGFKVTKDIYYSLLGSPT